LELGNVVSLAAPVSGTVCRVNEEVQDNPALVATSPYDEGWLLELQPEGEREHWQSGLLSAEAIQQRTSIQMDELRQVSLDANVGPTLSNGGEPIEDLRLLLGTERYHDVVRKMLS
jgi:hypothetical protein